MTLVLRHARPCATFASLARTCVLTLLALLLVPHVASAARGVDYSGDGRDDLAWYSGGNVNVLQTNGTGNAFNYMGSWRGGMGVPDDAWDR